jgi:hypothetical protein
VSLSIPDTGDPVLSDDTGDFVFTGLAAGRYELTAEKTGFVRTRYGSRTDLDPAMPIDVGEAAVVDNIQIRMLKGAAITGRVVDELGDPVVGAPVSIGFFRPTEGQSRFTGVSRSNAVTDDRGEYRIGSLAAGRYYVSVRGSSEGSPIAGAPAEWARTFGWSQTYYLDSASLAAATPIVLGAGEERTGVDFSVASSRSAKLTLNLVDAAGATAKGLINLFLPGDVPGSIVDNRGVPVSGMTPTLPPGEWVAVALQGAGKALAHVTLTSGEETSLTLTLGPGAHIAGRVIFDGSSAPPPSAGVRLRVRGVGRDAAAPAPGLSNGPVGIGPDGVFEITGVVGTVDLQPVSPLRGWALRSVRYGNRDLLDDPLTLSGTETISGVQVVFTDRLADLSGAVADAEGHPSPGCDVAVFPDGDAAAASRGARLVRADQNGRFDVPTLLAGSYLVLATPDIDASLWPTREYLSRIRPFAQRVTLTDREPLNLALTCMRVP